MQRLIVIAILTISIVTPIRSGGLRAGQEAAEETVSGSEAELKKVLGVVNGDNITGADLEFMMLSRNVPPEIRATARKKFLEQLVDQRLVRAYLAGRKATANPLALDSQISRIDQLIEKSGQQPKQVLAKLGYDDQRLRDELALPLAWQAYVRRVVTKKRLREFFESHKAELDGTEIRASQIVIKVPTDRENDALAAAEARLRKIRDDIVSGTTTFVEAARQYSESPSRDNGGDVGFLRYRGKMPVEFSKVAFSLEPGEVSQPFRTRYGVHLCQVTERHVGTLSLEDVRDQVFERLSREIWDDLVRDLRAQSRIEWK